MDYRKERDRILYNMPKVAFGDKMTEEQKELASTVRKELTELRDLFIEKFKPCPVGGVVDLVLNSGKKVENVIVVELGILHDGNVHPTAYKQGSKTRFITVPVKSLVWKN